MYILISIIVYLVVNMVCHIFVIGFWGSWIINSHLWDCSLFILVLNCLVLAEDLSPCSVDIVRVYYSLGYIGGILYVLIWVSYDSAILILLLYISLFICMTSSYVYLVTLCIIFILSYDCLSFV